MSELSEAIFSLVQGHSGGMKFTELIAKLDHREYGNAVAVQAILDAIDAHPKLAILVYGWDMGGDVWREKIFVYTPFPTSPHALVDVGGLLNDEVHRPATELEIHQAQLAKDACYPGSLGTTS